MSKVIRLLFVSSLAVLSGACATSNDNFGCKGLPEGVRCMSTREIYQATSGPQEPAYESPAAAGDSRDPDETPKPLPPITDPVVDTFITPKLPDRPVPVRTPSVVMRIKVFTWEDAASGALIAPGYVYTEIEPRRWTIGKPEQAASSHGRLYRPLNQKAVMPASQ